MRYLICLVAFLLCNTVKADDVYYVKSRLCPIVPQIGPFYHASVVICPDGEPPVLKGPDGKNIKNPACTYYGSTMGCYGLEVERNLWDLKPQKVEVRPAVVRARVESYDGKYNFFTRNCQSAAAYATDQRTAWRLWIKK